VTSVYVGAVKSQFQSILCARYKDTGAVSVSSTSRSQLRIALLPCGYSQSIPARCPS